MSKITQRGDINKILDILVQHGATPKIRVESHPHIGTNKLPKIIKYSDILTVGGRIVCIHILVNLVISFNMIVFKAISIGFLYMILFFI